MNVLTYEQLKQRLDAVVAENVELKYAINPTSIPDDAIDAFSDTVAFDSDSDGYHSWVSVSNEDEVIRAVMAVICKVETPATNAALAEVEAKTIEKFAAQQEEKLKAAALIGATHLEACHEFAALQARAFAVELREGRVCK